MFNTLQANDQRILGVMLFLVEDVPDDSWQCAVCQAERSTF